MFPQLLSSNLCIYINKEALHGEYYRMNGNWKQRNNQPQPAPRFVLLSEEEAEALLDQKHHKGVRACGLVLMSARTFSVR